MRPRFTAARPRARRGWCSGRRPHGMPESAGQLAQGAFLKELVAAVVGDRPRSRRPRLASRGRRKLRRPKTRTTACAVCDGARAGRTDDVAEAAMAPVSTLSASAGADMPDAGRPDEQSRFVVDRAGTASRRWVASASRVGATAGAGGLTYRAGGRDGWRNPCRGCPLPRAGSSSVTVAFPRDGRRRLGGGGSVKKAAGLLERGLQVPGTTRIRRAPL